VRAENLTAILAGKRQAAMAISEVDKANRE
jgi:hypothetical protein